MVDQHRRCTSSSNSVLIASVLLFVCAIGFISASSLATPPLRVSPNHRFLSQADGKPFFWMGDTNWRLYKLTRSQIDVYLDQRRSQKFNVIQGPVLLSESNNPDTTNAYGESNSDPTNPNEDWFDHIDYIVNAANDRGMYVALVTTWGDGWDNFASTDDAYAYGRFLGQRYRNFNNVIWVVAGEYIISGETWDIINRWDALGEGLRDGSAGRNLITIHGSFQWNRQSSSLIFHRASWLDFNMIQSSQFGNDGTGADNWNLVTIDYKLTPLKPTLDAEPNYEGIGGWDAFGVRRRAYWSVFAGAFGHTYGSDAVCISFLGGNSYNDVAASQTWSNALNFPGANDMKWLRRLMESRPMLKRIPDQSIVVGSTGSGVLDHIQATRDSLGRYAMIYVPQQDRTFTVKMSKIKGTKVKAWWFDPRNGNTKYINAYKAAGTRTFITPHSGQDWVLVLDDKAEKFPTPGTGGPLK